MAELLIRNSSVGFIKLFIFDKDGTLSNSEDYLVKLAKTRIKFSAVKLANLKINKIKIWLLIKLLTYIYGLKNNSISANGLMAIASRDQNIISTATVFSLIGFDWFTSFSITKQIFEDVDIFLSNKKESNLRIKPLVTGALDLLIALRNEEVSIALMTNDTKVGTEEFICVNKLDGIFDYLWSAESKPSKPNPMAVIELCKKMNCKPSETALISDADTDLKMAKDADIPIVIGFLGGWENPPTLTEHHLIIEKLNELKIQRNT